jgi:hypothetical protein
MKNGLTVGELKRRIADYTDDTQVLIQGDYGPYSVCRDRVALKFMRPPTSGEMEGMIFDYQYAEDGEEESSYMVVIG